MSLDFYSNPDLADGFNIWPHPWRSQPHRGLDFAKREGTPIPSVNAGVVVISEWNPYLGNIVEVQGSDGIYVGYCHLSKPGLPVGARVQVGGVVGEVGNTGSQSQGAHLHITKGDRHGAVRGASLSYLSDPWPYIQAAINAPHGEEEDEDMASKPQGRYIGGNASTPAHERVCVIYYPDSGHYELWSGTDQGFINRQASAHGTGDFFHITQKYWDQALKPQLEKLLAR